MVMVTFSNGKSVGMDGYLKSNLDIAKETIKRDLDHVFCVAGDERVGKSSLAFQCAAYCDETFCANWERRVHFTPENFLEGIKNSQPYEAHVYDEAMTGLSSRESMSRMNKTLQKVLAEVGQRNLFIFICIPDFFSLDSYIALHRSRCLLLVYFGERFSRGRFAFFGKDKKRNLYFLGKKLHNQKAVNPDFRGSFSGEYVVDETKYRGMKSEALRLHSLDWGVQNRNVDLNKFGCLLSWLIKDKSFHYEDIKAGMQKFGIEMSYDALRKVVYRYTSTYLSDKDLMIQGRGERV